MWASSRVQFLRGWDQIFLFFSPLSCWQGDPGEAGLVKRLHKGARESTIQCRQWAIIQWTIWARDVHSIQLLRHLRLPAGNLQLKQDLTQNMIWDLKLHHNVHHDTLFTLRATYPYTLYPDLKIIRTALMQGMWKLWKLGWKCQKGNMDFIHSDDGWCREDISKYFAKHWRLRHVYWDWLL